MHFMLSMIGEEPDFATVDPEEMQEIIDAMGAYNQRLHEAGAFVTAGGLQQIANTKTVRFSLDGDALVSDGPFAETKEHLAGFWVVDAPDFDAAVALAKDAPIRGAAIEVRPFGQDIDGTPGTDDTTAEELLERAQGKGPGSTG